MRLLVIEDDARYSAVLRHHLSCRWPDAKLVVASPVTYGALAPEFLAQGFDAMLLTRDWPGGRGIEWVRDLAPRRGFAPIIFLSERADDAEGQEALALGVHAVLSRKKLEHERLIEAVGSAAAKQSEARAAWRTSVEGIESQKFNGVHIRGYRCVRRLAGGAISDLFLAESEAAGALVVVKIARDQQKENKLDQSFRRFLQEYEIVERIRHPNIVRLYDLGVSDEHAYLVMEYFRAGDLRARMREGGLAPREALRYAISIGHALEAIHASGILHRDLKPGNVMRRDDASLALIDFGLAKDAALAAEMTDHGTIFGTPHYMSPEQGHAEPIDERSDLYSLGVILFEMLAGEKPYTADNPMAIIYKQRKTPIPKLPEAVAILQPLIEGLMAKQPADRFPSASAAVVALESAAARLP
jgi:serine/threonine protein kinase/CheY-like chemotaxis protein